jgi:hypothetical protein
MMPSDWIDVNAADALYSEGTRRQMPVEGAGFPSWRGQMGLFASVLHVEEVFHAPHSPFC